MRQTHIHTHTHTNIEANIYTMEGGREGVHSHIQRKKEEEKEKG